jgi:serine/threonine protein phosphatase PrpC
MPFEWRVFEMAKEPEHPEQNQDAWWLNAERGVAAIGDGVTSGIFSRRWAQLLTRAAVEDWPDPNDDKRFSTWLADLRRRWDEEVDTSGLAWYQRAKLRDGGFSTLVWLRLLDNDSLVRGGEHSLVEVMAIGDSCLFHVRNDEQLESFPLDASLQFDSSPLVLGSVDLKRDDQLQFERLEMSCREGDMLVLCTDAVAAWALDRQERGEPVAWSTYWDMPPEAWAEEIRSLREQSQMRYDDATLVLLRVTQVAGGSAEEYSPPATNTSEGSEPEEEVTLLVADDWGKAPETPDTPAERVTDEVTYFEPQTYQVQMPEPEVRIEPEQPPPVPAGAVPGQPPPPPSGDVSTSEEEDWRDRVNTFSERLFKKVSEGLSRGVDKLQEAKDSAVRRLREKTKDSSDDDEPTER